MDFFGDWNFRVLQELRIDRLLSRVWAGVLSVPAENQPPRDRCTVSDASRFGQASLERIARRDRQSAFFIGRNFGCAYVGRAISTSQLVVRQRSGCGRSDGCSAVRTSRAGFYSDRSNGGLASGKCGERHSSLLGQCFGKPGRNPALHSALLSLSTSGGLVSCSRGNAGHPFVEDSHLAMDRRAGVCRLRGIAQSECGSGYRGVLVSVSEAGDESPRGSRRNG